MSNDKPTSNHDQPPEPFDKLKATMEAVYQTRNPVTDDKEALKAILDSMKEPSSELGE
jgi:hypothetical protein